MSDYQFRGQPISGAGAYVLLGSIKRVLREAPNFTPEDIALLEEIVKDFEKKMDEALQQEYLDHQEDDDRI